MREGAPFGRSEEASNPASGLRASPASEGSPSISEEGRGVASCGGGGGVSFLFKQGGERECLEEKLDLR